MKAKSARLLLVDANPADARLVVEALEGRAAVTVAGSVDEARRKLQAEHFDLCIADLKLSPGPTQELLLSLRQGQPAVGRIAVGDLSVYEALVKAVNEAAVFRLLMRPLAAAQVRAVVDDFLRLIHARPQSDLVLVADDSEPIRAMVELILEEAGLSVVAAADGNEALAVLREKDVAVALVDLEMPGCSGFEVAAECRRIAPEVPIVVLSAHVQHQIALDCLASGAFDFVPKPFSREVLLFRVKRALAERRKAAEIAALRAAEPRVRQLVGDGPAIRDLLAKVRTLAASEETVVVTGETGSGKEALARELHLQSLRAAGPFYAVNCAAFTETLLESELFGHERGAFTGAVARRKGCFEVADGGTLFLDEVGETSLATQAKLLRVLEERSFVRVGGTSKVTVDVRVVAATHRDLRQLVEEKAFRADLYYRLCVIPLHMPALREHREDIPALLQHALARAAKDRRVTLSPRAVAEALEHPWPGNVRELFNAVARAVALCPGDRIETLELASAARPRPGGGLDRPLKAYLAEVVGSAELEYLRSLLTKTGGNLKQAAALAGIDRKSLYNKMRAYGLAKGDFR